MNAHEQARALLISDIRRYFIGPIGSSDELIKEGAWDRTMSGLLRLPGRRYPPRRTSRKTARMPEEPGPDRETASSRCPMSSVRRQPV